MNTGAPVVVLDDDPTGTQAVRDVPVVFAWPPATLRKVLQPAPAAVHLVTNVRAVDPRRAYEITRSAAESALSASPGSRVVLRGDSTLRGHVYEEYRGLCDALRAARPPAILLVPALPAAGRVTRDGTHYLVRDGRAVALHETEYAGDGAFAYRSAHLLEWADERSGGAIGAREGETISLDVLRSGGASAVAATLLKAADRARPAAVAPDAESIADLQLIADGLRLAERAGADVIVRCAPAFVGVLVGNLATELVPAPETRHGVLVVCGSYVPGSTRQLMHLRDELGLEVIELDPVLLAGPAADAETAVEAAARRARQDLERRGVAVVATARTRPEATRNMTSGMAIAQRLASVVPAVGSAADVIVAKGGITSAITLTHGVDVDYAWVRGPILSGVSLWEADGPRGRVAYVVVPGNVGSDNVLTQLVQAVAPKV